LRETPPASTLEPSTTPSTEEHDVKIPLSPARRLRAHLAAMLVCTAPDPEPLTRLDRLDGVRIEAWDHVEDVLDGRAAR
jgi:hypothetical protein